MTLTTRPQGRPLVAFRYWVYPVGHAGKDDVKGEPVLTPWKFWEAPIRFASSPMVVLWVPPDTDWDAALEELS